MLVALEIMERSGSSKYWKKVAKVYLYGRLMPSSTCFVIVFLRCRNINK